MSTQLHRAGGAAIFHREGATVQYLSLVASKALESQPQALLLLLSAAEPGASSKTQEGPFLVAGPAGGFILPPDRILDVLQLHEQLNSSVYRACDCTVMQFVLQMALAWMLSAYADFLLQPLSRRWDIKLLQFWGVGVVVGQADCKGQQNTLKRGSRLCS